MPHLCTRLALSGVAEAIMHVCGCRAGEGVRSRCALGEGVAVNHTVVVERRNTLGVVNQLVAVRRCRVVVDGTLSAYK